MNSAVKRDVRLDVIRSSLLRTLGRSIKCAVVYGSTLNSDYCRYSDIDILIVVKEPDMASLKKLRVIKSELRRHKLNVDFNVHGSGDLPQTRGRLFWHNNRGVYVQKELSLYGKVLIGRNLFSSPKIQQHNLQEEAVRVINSLTYQARKIIINKPMGRENKILLIKFCIYGALYVLAAKGLFPMDRRKAMSLFRQTYHPLINPEQFIDAKVDRPDSISKEDIESAYN